MARVLELDQCRGCGIDLPRCSLDIAGFCDDPACQEMETESLAWEREYYPQSYERIMRRYREAALADERG